MLQRIGIFIDVANQYYCVGKKWEGRKLNYESYLEVAQGDAIRIRAIAYGNQDSDEAVYFIGALKHAGYETKYLTSTVDSKNQIRKGDWKIGIALDIVRMLSRLDIVVLGSSDPDMVPVIKYIQEHGAIAKVVACGISRDLKDAANSYHEITEDMLMEISSAKATESG